MRAASTLPGGSSSSPARAPAKRVAICAAGEIWGGVEQFVVTLAVGLAAVGAPPLVILFHEGLLARRLRERGIVVAVLDRLRKYDPQHVRAVRALLVAERIGLLHVHGYRAMVIGGLAARAVRVPLLKTEHGVIEPPSSWQDAWGYLKLLANGALERALSRRLVDGVVFVSHDIRRRVHWRTDGVRQRVIYNGIEPIALPGEDAGSRRRAGFHVGIVGRITKVKGHLVLLDAMCRLGHLVDLHLHVFGSGPMEGRCRRIVRHAGLSERVTFHGFSSEIRRDIRKLDLLAIPSLHEGLPYTLLEAMSLEVPVVASAVGGLAEILEGDRTGILVPPNDDRALAASIERLYRSPDLCGALARAARHRVESRFPASEMVRGYRDLYAELGRS